MRISNDNPKGLKHLTLEELRQLINSLATDIEFEYNGKHGAICPINRQHIDVCYGEYNIPGDCIEKVCHSLDEVMKLEFIDGQSLNQLCDKILFDVQLNIDKL